jgi:hypothetical protein
MAVGLMCSHDLKSYAGSSIATGRVSQAGQVKSEVPDKDRHSGPPSWGLGIGLTSQSHKKQICSEEDTTEPSGMEENCIGSQSPQQTVVLKKKKKKSRKILQSENNLACG